VETFHVSVTVKICGITNREDAEAAVSAGANALGFIFYPRSPRAMTPAQAGVICAGLPGHVAKVGVFVNASPDEVNEAVALCGLNILQFHGDESPEYCSQFGIMTMKAFRVRDREIIPALPRYATHAWLLDAYNPVQLGGSGETFDWQLAVAANQLGKPIFLAGGLTPENVVQAIRQVKPFGVDVSSGVEIAPGRKDHEKVKAFVAAAKSVGDY
jgi:phosphoribosylanthranilate isomerase